MAAEVKRAARGRAPIVRDPSRVARIILDACKKGALPFGYYPESFAELTAMFPPETRGETYGARFDVNVNGLRYRVEVTEAE